MSNATKDAQNVQCVNILGWPAADTRKISSSTLRAHPAVMGSGFVDHCFHSKKENAWANALSQVLLQRQLSGLYPILMKNAKKQQFWIRLKSIKVRSVRLDWTKIKTLCLANQLSTTIKRRILVPRKMWAHPAILTCLHLSCICRLGPKLWCSSHLIKQRMLQVHLSRDI